MQQGIDLNYWRNIVTTYKMMGHHLVSIEVSSLEALLNLVGAPAPVLTVGELRIDSGTRKAFISDRELDLTRTEWSILWAVASRNGQIITFEDLIHEVWGHNDGDSARNTLKVQVCRLRQKMDALEVGPGSIASVRGIGFKLRGMQPVDTREVAGVT